MNNQTIAYIFNEAAVMNEHEFKNIQVKPNGIVSFEAVLQEANLPNRNNRIYPKTVLEAGIKSDFIQEKLRTNSLLGESNHPSSPDMQRQMNIDMNNASHVIKSLYWDKQDPNLLMGVVETASTTTDKNLAGLIRDNGMVSSFSMRGMGDVKRDSKTGKMVVNNPLKIITWDNVHYPSHQKAYQKSLHDGVTHRITTESLAAYAASNSSDFQQLNENFLQILAPNLSFELTENQKLVIHEKDKVRAIMKLEEKLQKEIDSILLSI
jgi:hypothetical protein